MTSLAGGALSPAAGLDPYWWRNAPRPAVAPPPLPAASDVAIVGSGITGLVAALHLARAGRRVSVLEAGVAGEGASSRNAGYVGRTLKHTFGDIVRSEGLERAIAVYREMRQAFDSVLEMVASEKIDCDLKQQGRFIMAATPAQYDGLARELDLRRRHLGEDFSMCSKAEQSAEINTGRYFGGAVIPDHAGLHPGKYHLGLLTAAERQGAVIFPGTPVASIGRDGGDFTLVTPRGSLKARQVLVATNGYSGGAFPWLRRRLIPFDAYMIATEPLDAQRVAGLLPGERTFVDWNFNVDFVRRAPDDPRRIVFGGLSGARNQDLAVMAARLRQRLARIFPGLAAVGIDNVWTGRCAGSFDLYPHIGCREGIHYAVGYCFAGLPMGTWFGRKVAERILGAKSAPSVFADRPFGTVPLYRGNAWFLPLAMRWLSRKDG
jgi:glycine/D-amino acid oxidase-like deaminating enzyme